MLVVLDTETTGFGVSRGRADGVVQIGLAYRIPGSSHVVTWGMTCNPGAEYLEGGRAREALRISGLDEDAVRASPSASEAASRLGRILASLRSEHAFVRLTAYNIDFDRPFLEASPWNLTGPWGECIMLNAHKALNPEGKWPRLTEACGALQIQYPGRAHEARIDAYAALLVHEALEARGTVRVPVVEPTAPRPERGAP